MIEFGNILKDLREEKQIKQIEVAKKIGIANNTLSQYEQNKAAPSIDVLIRIADYFDVSIDFLCGRTDNIFLKDEYQPKPQTTEAAEVLRLYETLNSREQAQVLGFVQALAENSINKKMRG